MHRTHPAKQTYRRKLVGRTLLHSQGNGCVLHPEGACLKANPEDGKSVVDRSLRIPETTTCQCRLGSSPESSALMSLVFPSRRHKDGSRAELAETNLKCLMADAKVLVERQVQLSSITSFMRSTSSVIARPGNAEEKCSGRFLAGRFKATSVAAVITSLQHSGERCREKRERQIQQQRKSGRADWTVELGIGENQRIVNDHQHAPGNYRAALRNQTRRRQAAQRFLRVPRSAAGRNSVVETRRAAGPARWGSCPLDAKGSDSSDKG